MVKQMKEQTRNSEGGPAAKRCSWRCLAWGFFLGLAIYIGVPWLFYAPYQFVVTVAWPDEKPGRDISFYIDDEYLWAHFGAWGFNGGGGGTQYRPIGSFKRQAVLEVRAHASGTSSTLERFTLTANASTCRIVVHVTHEAVRASECLNSVPPP